MNINTFYLYSIGVMPISDTRIKYSEKVDALMKEVARVKDQMHDNMQQQLSNMENADALHQKSQEALEEAMVFKKKTQSVKSKMRNKFI